MNSQVLKPCPCGSKCDGNPYQIDLNGGLFRLDCERAECGWAIIAPTAEQALSDWDARAMPAPVQQVSAPDGAEKCDECGTVTARLDGDCCAKWCCMCGAKLNGNYVAAPAPQRIQVCKLGRTGAAFDGPEVRYAYTYTDQPDNIGAMKLGRAAAINGVKRHGDEIDRGLHLLLQLQAEGFGVFQLSAAPTTRGDV